MYFSMKFSEPWLCWDKNGIGRNLFGQKHPSYASSEHVYLNGCSCPRSLGIIVIALAAIDSCLLYLGCS